jgi:hypothetical protein
MKQDNKDNVIENDEDTSAEDLYNGSLYPYKISEEDIDIKEDHISVFELIRKFEKGKLIINPEFQRNIVWNTEKMSRFIESVILGIPLPPLYVNQDMQGRYIIVDGLQRTATFNQFLKNKFKLTSLEALTDRNNKYFKDLNDNDKTKIEDKSLLLNILKPSMSLYLVIDIFNRINTGGTFLTRQEIRNCIYLGKATRLLKKLSEQEYFNKAIDYGISSKRMKDREAVLRYLAFKIFDYEKDYKGDMDDFLGNVLVKINMMKDSEIENLEKDFKRVMEYTFKFFKYENFRLPTDISRGRVNIAIMESVSYFFSLMDDVFLENNKTTIIKNFNKLLNNGDYIDAVRFSTGDKSRVINRFNLAKNILGKL